MRGPTLFLYGGKDDLIPKRAAAAAWERLPPGARTAFYLGGYHLMLRDLGRATPIGDVIAWIDGGTGASGGGGGPQRPCPSPSRKGRGTRKKYGTFYFTSPCRRGRRAI